MTFPTDWNHWVALTESSSRPSDLSSLGGNMFVVVHHAYNLTVQATIAMAEAGGKQVSENFAIGPTAPGTAEPIYCVGVVPESRRAFTTASWVDGVALTMEVSNIDLNSPYPVAQAAKEKIAQIVAYAHTEYGMPIDRWHVTSHQEVYARGWGSYATACPGGDLQGALDWICARAIQIVNGTPLLKEDDDMPRLVPLVMGAPPQFTGDMALIGTGKAQGYKKDSRMLSLLIDAGTPVSTVGMYGTDANLVGTAYGDVTANVEVSPEDMEALATAIAEKVEVEDMPLSPADLAKIDALDDDERAAQTATILAAIAKLPAEVLAEFGLQRVP